MRDAHTPAVTLVCVTPDADAPGLDRTVRSIQGQEQGLGVLVVTPSTAEAAQVLAGATGWVGFVDPGDVLEPDALEQLLGVAAGEPLADLLYSDETSGDLTHAPPTPFRKPAWSPDRLRCQPYTGRLTLTRAASVAAVGGLRADLGVCAEHDLILRIGEHAARVAHLPEVLCHRTTRAAPYPTFDPVTLDVACRVTDDHLQRAGLEAVARPHASASGLLRLEPRLRSRPMVSIVIPTGGARRAVRGHELNLVVNCVQSILSRSRYAELEIVCVMDSTVDEPTRSALVEADPDRVRLLDFDGTFHFARKVNRGALAASGDVLLFLNDDTEIVTPGWIEAMLVYALDPDVGAVGARLLFENGCIQHAGVVGVRGNPGHPYHGLPASTPGHGANALVPADFLAVTGACLMTRRDCFAEAGGMSAWFPASYNDLDYCLKLGRLGYRVVATPDAVLEHFESSSRSGAVASRELELIRRRWGRLLRDDPFYSPGFPSGIADFEAVVSTP